MLPPPPSVLSYGIGVDSTALLIELHARGQAPDLVLSADTGNEKPETYDYLDIIRPWMRDRGIRFELVSYVPKRFKHWPPYFGILEMCLTNATLPSKSLGGSSCSLGLGPTGVPLACEGRTGRATRLSKKLVAPGLSFLHFSAAIGLAFVR